MALKATMRIFAKFEKNHTITAMEQAITVKVADTPFLDGSWIMVTGASKP